MICLGSRVEIVSPILASHRKKRIAIVYEISGTTNYKGEPAYYTVEDDGHCGARLLHDLVFVEQCSGEELLTHKFRAVRKIGLNIRTIDEYCDQVSRPLLKEI